MTKNEFRTNLDQAASSFDCSLTVEELNFCVEVLYDPKQPWYFDDYYEFGRELRSEDGDLMYTLEQIDGYPVIDNHEDLVRKWLKQNEKIAKKIAKDEDPDHLNNLDQLDFDAIADWFDDNEKEHRKIILYIVETLKKGGK